MCPDTESDLSKASHILENKQENLSKRFRALFTLRNIVCPESIDTIGKVLLNDDSDLLKHECAYCMGQMKNVYAISYLIKALQDECMHPMVRHEAAEALGAIGRNEKFNIDETLEKYKSHEVRELAETCQLALDRVKWYESAKTASGDFSRESLSPYNTVDPTPSYPSSFDIEELKKIYLDTSRSLFDRYRALFTLRNIATPEAVGIICDGFFCGDEDSALFKHEVAFVLGQMQDKLSINALNKKLSDLKENEMVRHECAEALGSIGESQVIQGYLSDESRIVRESCEVALDMAQYEKDESQFDFLTK